MICNLNVMFFKKSYEKQIRKIPINFLDVIKQVRSFKSILGVSESLYVFITNHK